MRFIKRHPLVAASGVLLIVLSARWLMPIYGFYAHKGDIALPPTGWTALPEEAPSEPVSFTHMTLPTILCVLLDSAYILWRNKKDLE